MNITLCYFRPTCCFLVMGAQMIFEGKQSILKTRDLAILLDLSPDVVNDMARRGHLKGFKSGNQWRFRRRDVERYIERMKKLAPPG
jgi:excisionase family DNA binding protein